MRKLKAIAFSIAAAFVFVAAPTAYVGASQSNPQLDAGVKVDEKGLATLALPTCNPRLSAANASGQEIFLSTSNPRTYVGTTWQEVSCTATTFKLKFGQRAIITSDFNAEADCNGPAGQWCKTRAILTPGGVAEGAPLAPEGDSFAFDSASGGINNWQAHAMNRAWERTCLVSTGCTYRFSVQTQLRDLTSSMWLDEVAVRLHVTIGPAAAM